MKTNIEINQDLLNRARELTQFQTEAELNLLYKN